MGRGKLKIISAMQVAGFTGEIKLYYWSRDGWYGHCDQFQHEWMGQSTMDVLETLRKGELNRFLKDDDV